MLAITIPPLALNLPGGGAISLSARVVSKISRTAAEGARRALHDAKSAPEADLFSLVERAHEEHDLVRHLLDELDARIAELTQVRGVLTDGEATITTSSPMMAAAQQVRAARESLLAAQPGAALDVADDALAAVDELLGALLQDRLVAQGLAAKTADRARRCTVRALSRGCRRAATYPVTAEMRELLDDDASPEAAVEAARLAEAGGDEAARRATARRKASLRADLLADIAETWSRADAR